MSNLRSSMSSMITRTCCSMSISVVSDMSERMLARGSLRQSGVCSFVSRMKRFYSLIGPNELKRPQDGMPHPVLLRLHRASTFRDTTYLARQVFTFSCHSWRSFFPSPMPVTIFYSRLIAKLLGQLAMIPRWNPEAMLGRIGRTRWFL